MEGKLSKVGLSDESFKDFSTINRLQNAALMTNEIVLQVVERLLVRQSYDFIALLAPECVLSLIDYNTFRKRVRNLESTVNNLKKKEGEKQG